MAEVECRDGSLFKYGVDYEELRGLCGGEFVLPIVVGVRVYNFA